MNKIKKYIAPVIISLFGLVLVFGLKNPLIKTNSYFSKEPNITVYRQLFKSDNYFIKHNEKWFSFSIDEEMVFLPNRPDQLLGFYFFNHDMSIGVPITFDIKVENGYINWENMYFEFSHSKLPKYTIYKEKD
ncbi:hypothetical protein LNTAR_06309 [Lentisphaera araneosa HTCC2155]|uniref:Uncharacterized protein n=1 Tax=Lentisphaera araneosa HTCC2155 TaxID=313628 RepID=A6DN88_9BACT|nr:hypothetical protein [Lentisphaera araneosa]EDM26836.1 hypothetical protein LNTAR_06309 [Lentisphaera araneosa HTCC2155]